MENPHGYRGILFAFMKYRDNVVYDEKTFVFTPEHLSEVSAQDVVDWFHLKAYGVERPGEADRPTHARSNSLFHWKKALSYYMPNRNTQWNELSNTGNPTKSVAVNELIKKVKRFEVRGQGSAPKARRLLKELEFRAIVGELHKCN